MIDKNVGNNNEQIRGDVVIAKVTPNSDQQKAIDTIDRPVLISAEPDTVKTATLVKRYANMVNNHRIT